MCLDGFAVPLFAATSFWLNPASYWAMFQMAAGLGFVVFVHEMGHFLVAKACGVKCEKFYIGFDFFDIKIAGRVIVPRSLFKFQWGETEYGIGIIPLGGYVKMLGQDDDPRKYEDEMARSREAAKSAKSNEDKPGQDKPSESAETEAVAKSELKSGETPHHESVTDLNMEPTPLAGDSDETFEHDPRSYQAKNVPQRMAIISAGVIMNVIFAVVFAMLAYSLGVSYTPTEIGRLAPGGAAYIAGVPTGGKIIQLGEHGKRSEHLRFNHDLRQAVAMAGSSRDLKVLVRLPDGEEKWYSLRPQATVVENRKRKRTVPVIGVMPSATTAISPATLMFKQLPAANIENGFQANDVVLSVSTPDGPEVTIGDAKKGDYHKLEKYLADHADQPITFVVARPEKKSEGKEAQFTTVSITVPPNPTHRFGLVMKPGPIKFVREGSTGAEAGLEVGDQLLEVAGEPLGDPLSLPDRLRAKYGEEVAVKIQRGKEEKTLQVKVASPAFAVDAWSTGTPFTLQEFGIGFPLLREVVAVEPDSPAAKAGLEPGDLIDSVEFLVEGTISDEMKNLAPSAKTINLIPSEEDPRENWMSVQSWLQYLVPENKIKLTYTRGDQQKTVDIGVYDAPDQFNANRGIHFMLDEQVYQAASIGEAFSLGVQDTKENLMMVVFFLRGLIVGEISPTDLGGPGTIAVVGTSEAMQGFSNFLLFLTVLSANLAVVNFLPIPVLDGGHMMFLTYEAIFRRPVHEKWFVALSLAGLAFVLGLMLFVVSLDYFHLSSMFG